MQDKFEKTIFILLVLFGISTSVSIAATNFLLGLLFLLFIMNWVKTKKVFYSIEGLPLLFLFCWRGLRGLSSLYHHAYWLKYCGKFWDHIPYFVIPNVKTKKTRYIIYITLFIASFIALLGIIQFFLKFEYPFLPLQPFREGHFLGLNFVNRMHTGGYYGIITGFCLVFFCFLAEDKKLKYIFLICFLINISAVLLAQARTYYVAIGLTVFLILLAKSVRWFLLGSCLVIIAAFGVFQLNPQFKNRFVSIFNTKDNMSNLERLWMWDVSLRIIKKQPLTGVGYKNWKTEVENYFEREKEKNPLVWLISRSRRNGVSEQDILSALKAHPHNAYLNVAVDDGIIGLILFLLFWIGNLVQAFRRAKKNIHGSLSYALNMAVGFSITMLLIGGVFENNLTTARLLLPMTFFIGLSYGERARLTGLVGQGTDAELNTEKTSVTLH